MRNILFFFFLLLLPLLGGAQGYDNALNKGNGLLIHLSYGGHSPGGDLADRFGPAFAVGSGLDFITTKNNWIAGLDFSYYFGANVNEDVLASLRTPEGFIIGNDRSYSDIRLRMRGFYAGGHIGKVLGLGFANPRSGIRLTLGAGLLQHKVRIQDDPQSGVPQLSDEYKKGYDRLSNGLAFTEFVGYQVLSMDRRVNFYIGMEFTQGLTMSRRDYNFDTRSRDETERLDLLFGFKAGWILPIYFGKGSEEIYY